MVEKQTVCWQEVVILAASTVAELEPACSDGKNTYTPESVMLCKYGRRYFQHLIAPDLTSPLCN